MMVTAGLYSVCEVMWQIEAYRSIYAIEKIADVDPQFYHEDTTAGIRKLNFPPVQF